MKIKPVFVGLLAGVAGILLLVLYLKRFEQEVSGGRRVELLVAVQPIQRGKTITEEMLGTREVPQAYVDDRSIRVSDREKIVGLRATTSIPVEQTLQWTDVIASTDDQRDLSSLVQPGHRAMPIRVVFDDEIPLIHPGDFVDVIGVFVDQTEARVLMQRVLVLATGQDTGSDRSTTDKTRSTARMSTLNLSVTLAQGQLLALAMEKGKLTVVVRNPDDQKVGEAADVSVSALGDAKVRETFQFNKGRAGVPTKLLSEQQTK
jgi:pilus assembly protein CpaB